MLLLLLSFPAVGRTDYYDCKVETKTRVRGEGKEAAATLVTKRTDMRTEEKRGEVGDMKQH